MGHLYDIANFVDCCIWNRRVLLLCKRCQKGPWILQSSRGCQIGRYRQRLAYLYLGNAKSGYYKRVFAQLTREMYVVANSRYVYDISTWLKSHPGGQIILQTVCGTDITNEYFHESGFDASEFTAVPKVPAKPAHRSGSLKAGVSRADMIAIQRNKSVKSASSVGNAAGPNFTQEDWKAIQRSRRTHVHTRLALEKLSSLVVGEIVTTKSDLGSSATLNNSEVVFDPNEYRRYALTEYVRESPLQATNPFIRLRFCLLYPFDTRRDQPTKFLPGQSIEIEMRLADGTRISRYYTPICGDMNSFEILVKIKPQGQMSEYLFKAQKGERQYKIRGPFGEPLLPRANPDIAHLAYYDTIYFFAGGSGITPCLQLLNHIHLPINQVRQVIQNYEAMMSDELSIRVSDHIQILHQYTFVNLVTMTGGHME